MLLLSPASCRGGRLSSELWLSVPESGGSTQGRLSCCATNHLIRLSRAARLRRRR
uniref:Uncharacterized protein n=1 Tax=Aegilops tauschii subsp. strangulata TaxID=200361 RepID=A0A453CBZ6_AEGTS